MAKGKMIHIFQQPKQRRIKHAAARGKIKLVKDRPHITGRK